MSPSATLTPSHPSSAEPPPIDIFFCWNGKKKGTDRLPFKNVDREADVRGPRRRPSSPSWWFSFQRILIVLFFLLIDRLKLLISSKIMRIFRHISCRENMNHSTRVTARGNREKMGSQIGPIEMTVRPLTTTTSMMMIMGPD